LKNEKETLGWKKRNKIKS